MPQTASKPKQYPYAMGAGLVVFILAVYWGVEGGRSVAKSPILQLGEITYNAGRETPEFKKKFAALEEAGQPVSLEAAIAHDVSQTKNANYHFFQAWWLIDGHKVTTRPNGGWFNEIVKSKLGEFTERDVTELPQPKRMQLAAEAIDRVMDCDQSAPLMDIFLSDLLLSHDVFKAVVDIEFERCEKAVEEDRFDDLGVSALRGLKLCRVFSNEPGDGPGYWPWLIALNFDRMLNRAIRKTDLSPELLGKIDDELILHDSSSGRTQKAIEARAYYIDDIRGNDGVNLRWAFQNAGEIMDMYEHQISLTTLPWSEASEKFHPGIFGKKNGDGRSLEWAFEKRHAHNDYHIASIRSLRILIAIQKFINKKGREPSGVDELNITDECLACPVTGKSFVVSRKEGQWWIEWEWGDKPWFFDSIVDQRQRCIPVEAVEALKASKK